VLDSGDSTPEFDDIDFEGQIDLNIDEEVDQKLIMGLMRSAQN